jgi:hypothetical protein
VNQDGSELNGKLQVLVYGDVFLTQGASVNRAILQHCFFWFGNTGTDTAIAILLQTLKGFICNGAVDWSTKCFCYEKFYKNGDSLGSLGVDFEESSGFIAIILFHQPMSSRSGFETSRLLVLN